MRMTRRGALAGSVALAIPARKPLAASRMRALSDVLKPTDPPVPPPPITYVDSGGTARGLDGFAGHGLVVNLWATWCVPCVAELPSLARLSTALAGDGVVVLPLCGTREGAESVRAFFVSHWIEGLPALLDPGGAAVQAWGVRGIPTSLILDRQGREQGRLEGSADWAAPDAVALVRRLALSS